MSQIDPQQAQFLPAVIPQAQQGLGVRTQHVRSDDDLFERERRRAQEQADRFQQEDVGQREETITSPFYNRGGSLGFQESENGEGQGQARFTDNGGPSPENFPAFVAAVYQENASPLFGNNPGSQLDLSA